MGELALALKTELERNDVRHLVSVANGEGAALYFACKEDPSFWVIDACREGEAVGIGAGIFLGGNRPLVSMENFGLYECLDTLRALPIDMGIPLVLLVGYTARPKPGSEEALRARLGNAATQASLAGRWTERVLDLAEVPHFLLETAQDADAVSRAVELADKRRGPIALLTEGT